MSKLEYYKLTEIDRREIWNKLEKIEKAVSKSKSIVQNEMPLTQEDELDTFYFAINYIIEDLMDTKHLVNDSKKLFYTEIYDENGDTIETITNSEWWD